MSSVTCYVLVARHPAFGTLYLGRGCPVKSRSQAVKFGSEESARERLEWWQSRVEKDGLDPKFFGSLVVESR